MGDKIKSSYYSDDDVTSTDFLKPSSILKQTASPDEKFKNGRVLTWSTPLIEVKTYDRR